jgi:LysM repeat protein
MSRWQAAIENLRRASRALGAKWVPIVLAGFCLIQVALGARGVEWGLAPRVQAGSAEMTELGPTLPPGMGAASVRGMLTASIDDLIAELDEAWNAQDWPRVLTLIDAILAIEPTRPGMLDQKYFAHVNYGFQLMVQGRCTEALAQFRAALEIHPSGTEALAGIQLLPAYCPTLDLTPTPTPLPPVTPVVTPTPTFITPSPTPLATLTPTPIILPEPIQYTVQPGDTLYSLARRYNTTVQAIMQANGMMTYLLRVGQVITIPATHIIPVGPIVHIVQPGETLHFIANKYGTTVWALMVLNNLHSSTIYAYQAIFVPSAMQPGPIIHIVQPGQSLHSIANTYGTTVPLIMLANNMNTYVIHVYQRIIIPPRGWTGYPPIFIGTGPPILPTRFHPPSAVRRHVVQPGDTLYSLAIRYGTTVRAIQAANGLTSSRILVGTTLIIP